MERDVDFTRNRMVQQMDKLLPRLNQSAAVDVALAGAATVS